MVGKSPGFRRPCRRMPLAPPPTVAWIFGHCLPLFVCPAPPWGGGGRDLSSCVVLFPRDQAGDACNYRLRALVSVTLWAVLPLLALFGLWHTQSELHDLSCIGAVSSFTVGKHSIP